MGERCNRHFRDFPISVLSRNIFTTLAWMYEERYMKFLWDYLWERSRPVLLPVDPCFLCMLKLCLVQGWRAAIITVSGNWDEQPLTEGHFPSQQIKGHSGLLLASSSGCSGTSKLWAVSFECTVSALGWLDKEYYKASQSLWWTQFIKGMSYPSLCD